jgi:hypothetical protein
VARWTDRRLIEAETAIAIAIGDLTAVESSFGACRRGDQTAGRVMLAAASSANRDRRSRDVRALLDYATSRRTTDAAALAL